MATTGDWTASPVHFRGQRPRETSESILLPGLSTIVRSMSAADTACLAGGELEKESVLVLARFHLVIPELWFHRALTG